MLPIKGSRRILLHCEPHALAKTISTIVRLNLVPPKPRRGSCLPLFVLDDKSLNYVSDLDFLMLIMQPVQQTDCQLVGTKNRVNWLHW